MPAIAAVVRGTIVSAAKGNSRSQGQAIELYTEMCRQQENLKEMLLFGVFDGQYSFAEAQAKAAERGIPFPQEEPASLRQQRLQRVLTDPGSLIEKQFRTMLQEGREDAASGSELPDGA